MDKKILRADYFKDRVFSNALSMIKKSNKILVWGDEDPDGMTATIILVNSLKSLGFDTLYFIPSREKHGIGLHKKQLREFIKKGIDLVITVDCGTVNIEEQEYVRGEGINIIITDHHIPYRMPAAEIPLINPHKLKAEYFRNLSGAGVALIFAIYIEKQMMKYTTYDNVLKIKPHYSAMASIGTICDRVRITGFNRYISKMKRALDEYYPELSREELNGISLCSLFHQSKTYRNKSAIIDIYTKQHISERKKNILLSEMAQKGKKQIRYFQSLCKREIKKINKNDSIIVHYNPELKGIYAGIVASFISRKMQKPVLVIGKKGNELSGEVRSISINWVNILKQYSHYFTSWGGHKNAAGFSMDKKNVSYFIADISSQFNSSGISGKAL